MKDWLFKFTQPMAEELMSNFVMFRYIPMYSKNQMETPNTPHSLFFYRQFWSALKLFRNILAWQVR